MVLAGVAVLALLPSVVGAVPAPRSAISAPALLARILRSADVPHSGFAESTGGMDLPVSGQLNSLTELLGGHTQQRVWWRGPQDFRVDTITATGESDRHEDSRGTLTWNYESGAVAYFQGAAPRLRLPSAFDLLPSELGRRVLSGSTPAEVTRRSGRRIAGRSTVGLRLRPSAPQASIDHVDVWADAATGIPLRVDVFAKGQSRPALSCTFLDFSAKPPPARDLAFTLPPGAPLRPSGGGFDLVRFIDGLSGVPLPRHLGFAARNDAVLGPGAIGVYGRGITQFVVLQLPQRTAQSLRAQLAPAQGAGPPREVSLQIAPLNLVLTAPDAAQRTWLLVGTVTQSSLEQAARALALPRWVDR